LVDRILSLYETRIKDASFEEGNIGTKVL